MATYNVHAGHNPAGKIACGASGLLDESRENRLVKGELINDCSNNYQKPHGHFFLDSANALIRADFPICPVLRRHETGCIIDDVACYHQENWNVQDTQN